MSSLLLTIQTLHLNIKMITFPPSPTLSVCDSLQDIDDLDAFLEAQGSLSQFPTPPLKKLATVEEVEIFEEDYEEDVDYQELDCQ